MIKRRLNLDKDYKKIRKMLQKSFMKSTVFGVGALDYTLFMENEKELYESMKIWERKDGKVCAIAWAGTKNLNIVCHPDFRNLEVEIMDLFEKEFEDMGKNEIKTECFDKDAFRAEVLKKKDYKKIERSYQYFAVRDLSKSVPAPNLTKGYEIRSLVDDETGIEKRAELNEIAADKMDKQQYKRMRKASSYKTGLDLVAVYDEEIVAFCTSWWDEVNKCGLIEPIGVKEEHRKKGLGKELLYESMRRLIKYGGEKLHVSTYPVVINKDEDDSGPARALYQSVGFEEIDRGYTWIKKL